MYRCNIEYRGIERLLAQTQAVLKSAYPDEEFSFEEVQIYSLIAHGFQRIWEIGYFDRNYVHELFGLEIDSSISAFITDKYTLAYIQSSIELITKK